MRTNDVAGIHAPGFAVEGSGWVFTSNLNNDGLFTINTDNSSDFVVEADELDLYSSINSTELRVWVDGVRHALYRPSRRRPAVVQAAGIS